MYITYIIIVGNQVENDLLHCCLNLKTCTSLHLKKTRLKKQTNKDALYVP